MYVCSAIFSVVGTLTETFMLWFMVNLKRNSRVESLVLNPLSFPSQWSELHKIHNTRYSQAKSLDSLSHA